MPRKRKWFYRNRNVVAFKQEHKVFYCIRNVDEFNRLYWKCDRGPHAKVQDSNGMSIC